MEKMQKVRIIRKNDADSLEYEVGDILDVEGTWYGGVNVKGRSGIPLSLDREEYEEYRQEPRNAAGQEEQTDTQGRTDMQDRKNGGIDPYSYQLGVMDCFCEMVASGLKTLAMSHPFSDRQERDRYLEDVKRLCEKYEILFYPEDEALLTALFPEEANRNRPLFLFYRKEETLEAYLSLKKERKVLLERGEYTEKEKLRLAHAFGRLLSYPEDGIERLIQKTRENEIRR